MEVNGVLHADKEFDERLTFSSACYVLVVED
jgi:hypothetical protein